MSCRIMSCRQNQKACLVLVLYMSLYMQFYSIRFIHAVNSLLILYIQFQSCRIIE